MDLTTLDVTDVPDVALGDIVTIYGKDGKAAIESPTSPAKSAPSLPICYARSAAACHATISNPSTGSASSFSNIRLAPALSFRFPLPIYRNSVLLCFI